MTEMEGRAVRGEFGERYVGDEGPLGLVGVTAPLREGARETGWDCGREVVVEVREAWRALRRVASASL